MKSLRSFGESRRWQYQAHVPAIDFMSGWYDQSIGAISVLQSRLIRAGTCQFSHNLHKGKEKPLWVDRRSYGDSLVEAKRLLPGKPFFVRQWRPNHRWEYQAHIPERGFKSQWYNNGVDAINALKFKLET